MCIRIQNKKLSLFVKLKCIDKTRCVILTEAQYKDLKIINGKVANCVANNCSIS